MLTRGAQTRLSSIDVSISISLEGDRVISDPGSTIILQMLSLQPDGVLDADLPSVAPLASIPTTVP